MERALEALDRLREGNRRFVADARSHSGNIGSERRDELVSGQKPFAVILGCSDSRVPAELVFAQGLGDLFVIRVAGNIVAPSQIGSVEFAVDQFNTRLVVVLGHSRCGAVSATINELERPTEKRSPNLRSIVDRIEPVVRPLMQYGPVDNREKLLDDAVRANIHSSVDRLRHGSAILENLVVNDGLLIVGAEYSLDTGLVEFFPQVGGKGSAATTAG